MYNYGSPRVGNMVFVKQFNQLVPVQSCLGIPECQVHGLLPMCGIDVMAATRRRPECSLRQDAWRVFNARDLVCSVPRMMGFAHVGTPVELCVDGTYAVQGELLLAVGRNITALRAPSPATVHMRVDIHFA